ncbi:DNA-processing protein DprA [Virgibacillus xinjiangensis]|uniref:DNA-processing protein DprA n=1 Tax=Virgibacillus xinjiangensis TaxID=393090 RepID=A0ABV7CV25_9BACI
MEQIRKNLIVLHRCRGVTRRVIRRILHTDPSLQLLPTLSPQEISNFFTLPYKNASLLYTDYHHDQLWYQVERDEQDYEIITMVDENYPPMIKPIKDKPLVLYTLGDTRLLTHRPSLSVIGTRNPTMEAPAKMRFILEPLIERGWLVVSGMAKGIDSHAHRLALSHRGKTIAVLGSGFWHMYPKENKALFEQIAHKGLLVSEYPPNNPPRKFHFPERNRIISGLSSGTLVIEATEKSGTLITVGQALDQGREVYALPGSPLCPQTKGCHRMIQDGAKLVMEPKDILEDWQIHQRDFSL